MKIELKRISNERCYLFGKIYIEGRFICDTLEFYNETTLKSDTYHVKLYREPATKEYRVYIVDGNDKIVSKMVTDNTLHEKNFRIRQKNSLIEIGLKHELYWLIMFSFVNQILIAEIQKSDRILETVELCILNDIYCNTYEEPVTQY